MSGEQAGASSSGSSCSKAKKTRTARVLKAAKAAKKNSKIGRTITQDPNQARLMEVFAKLSLEEDAATSANDTEMDGNGRMDIEPSAPIDNAGAVEIPASIANAGAIPKDIPAYYEQRDDKGEEAAAIRKPRHRRRKNRKANNIDDAQPILPKKEPSRPVAQVSKTEPPVEPVVPTLSYSHVVLPEANRSPKLKIGPEPNFDRNEDSDIEDDYDYYHYQSDDESWEQDYEDQERIALVFSVRLN